MTPTGSAPNIEVCHSFLRGWGYMYVIIAFHQYPVVQSTVSTDNEFETYCELTALIVFNYRAKALYFVRRFVEYILKHLYD